MPVHISTPLTNTFFIDETNQGWVLDATGSITVASGHGFFNGEGFDHSAISVAGNVVADAKYRAGIFSDGANAALTIEKQGSIHGYNGISFYGDHTHAENLGTISAANVGIYGNGVGSEIVNAGKIDAKFGIYVDSPETGGSKTVENSGIISADYGVLATHSNFGLRNMVGGEIHSSKTAVFFGNDYASDHNNLENFGLIESSGVAIQGGIARDYVENHGAIKGSIFLGDGDDTFDNRGGTIDHAVNGGSGDDTYIFGAKSFTIIDSAGTDAIGTEITRTLADFPTIENLLLLGTANINGTGNALQNYVIGNEHDNILDGGNDNVVDLLMGGMGNDTYILRDGMDQAGEQEEFDSATDYGTDTIISTIGRNLANYNGIENLEIVGAADANGTGSSRANVITGNSGKNILDGGVENGDVIDTLIGGAGNDIYVLGNGHDKVIDSAGLDTITTLISRNLSTFATVEHLKLLGVSNLNATGNALANTLTGNAGVNALSGAAGNDILIGGIGADKLDGGANIDTSSYAGASAGVTANLGNSSLNAGDAKGDTYISIENLSGSTHNDALTGNAGANVLTGAAGADKLTGGAGADTFVFKAVGDSTLATTGQDIIYDFSHVQGDTISLLGIDANTSIVGNQAFVFKGSAAFSGETGELHFDKQASDTFVYGDINGDKVADFVLHFDDAITFQASDFLL